MGAVAEADPFDRVIQDEQRRSIRTTRLDVVDNHPKGRSKNPVFGLPGTMTLVVGRKGSGALEEFRAALGEGGDRLVQIQKKMAVKYEALAKQSQTADSAVKKLLAEPVIADIRYGGVVLNSGIHLPRGMDLAVGVLPYNGGRLAREGFTLVEHFKEGSDAALEAVVVEAAPDLSAAEKAALKLVPPDQLSRNVGTALSCRTTWIAVTVVGATLVGIVAIGALNAATVIAIAAITAAHLAKPVHITDEQIAKLGPAASAREILAMRRKAVQTLFDKAK
jgi:hypothetical protein